jgi:RHS repeat-associated protein
MQFLRTTDRWGAICAGLAVFLLGSALPARGAQPVNVTGTWTGTQTVTEGGMGTWYSNATAVLTQTGTTFTGTLTTVETSVPPSNDQYTEEDYVGETFSDDITGTVSGNVISWTVNGDSTHTIVLGGDTISYTFDTSDPYNGNPQTGTLDISFSGGGGGGGNQGNGTGPTITGNPQALLTVDQSNRKIDSVGGPVDTGTGAENFSRTLIALSWLRELDFTVSYNSVQVTEAADLGYGWSHPYLASAQLITDSSGNGSVVVEWSQNHANTYAATDSTDTNFQSTDFSAQYDTLVSDASGGYVLTRPDGTKYTFTAIGSTGLANLTQIANRVGQVLDVHRNSAGTQLVSIVEPVSGAYVGFVYTSGRITKVADSAGRSVGLAYDAKGNLTKIVDMDGHAATYAYDANHRMTSVTAANGSVIYANTYDSYGRVASQSDGLPGNPPETFSYDESSMPGEVLTTVTDHTGARTIYAHDLYYNLLSVTDPLQHITTYTYDTTSDLTGITDGLGRNTTFTYDTYGNISAYVDAAGCETDFSYDANHNVLSITNPALKMATFAYDSNNNPTLLTDFAGNATSLAYGAHSELVQATSPKGGVTTYGYSRDRLTSIMDARGDRTTCVYDAAGRVTSVTDPTGAIRRFTYSTGGNLLSWADGLGHTTTYSYDVRGRLVTTTDPVGGVTKRTYDGNSNLSTLTDPLKGVRIFAYDGQNRVTRYTDPLGNRSGYSYDADGRLAGADDPLGNVTQYAYDAVGNLVSVRDPMGYLVIQVTYDARNQPLTATDALGRTTTATYDTLKNLVSTTDPLGKATSFSYDAANRLTKTMDPLGMASSQSYDADGNCLGLTNAASAALTFAYDKGDRLTAVATATHKVTAYSYDPRSIVSKIVDPAGNATSLTYDAGERLTKTVDPLSEIDYTYDAKNRLETVVENGIPITRTYDADDRLTKFKDADGYVLNYSYDAGDNLTALTYPDGKQVTYAYDKGNRLTTVTDWAGRITRYTYDRDGRLVTTTRPNSTVQSRIYNAAGQLTGLVDTASDGSKIVQCSYSYDADGRVVLESRSPAAPAYVPVAAAMTFDADNAQATYAGHGTPRDANGNMLLSLISGTVVPVAYDVRNRLVSAGGVGYSYDAENRRVRATSGGTTTTYIVNPNAPLSQLLISKTAAGAVTRNVYGIGLIYQDSGGTAVTYLHGDYRGSTIAVTGPAGTVTGRIEYGPYGEIVTQSGATTTTFKYIGQAGAETDPNGLVYMRARVYNPALRRFLQNDGLLLIPGVSGTDNRYAYTGDRPSDRSDPLGMDWSSGPQGSGGYVGPAISGGGNSYNPEIGSAPEKGATGQPNSMVPGIIGNVVGLAAGLLQTGAGLFIAVTTWETGVGAWAGGVLTAEGLAQTGASIYNLRQLYLGKPEATVSNSGVLGLAGSLAGVSSTSTAGQLLSYGDLGVGVAAGGIAVPGIEAELQGAAGVARQQYLSARTIGLASAPGNPLFLAEETQQLNNSIFVSRTANQIGGAATVYGGVTTATGYQ